MGIGMAMGRLICTPAIVASLVVAGWEAIAVPLSGRGGEDCIG